MYQGPASAGAATAAATLPFTGPAIDTVWIGLGGFALFAAGAALWRAIPRRER